MNLGLGLTIDSVSPPFSAANVAGLAAAWYSDNATAGATFTLADSSGNAKNATQGTASLQPTIVGNSLNGHPAVLFDGVDDYLQAAPVLSGASVVTVFVVGNTVVNPFADKAFYGMTGTGGNVVLYDRSLNGADADPRTLALGTFNSDYMQGQVGTAVQAKSPAVTCAVHNIATPASGLIYYNGNSLSLATTGTPVARNPLSNAFFLGGASASLFFLNCKLYACIVYVGALATTDRNYITRGLGSMYGLAVV